MLLLLSQRGHVQGLDYFLRQRSYAKKVVKLGWLSGMCLLLIHVQVYCLLDSNAGQKVVYFLVMLWHPLWGLSLKAPGSAPCLGAKDLPAGLHFNKVNTAVRIHTAQYMFACYLQTVAESGGYFFKNRALQSRKVEKSSTKAANFRSILR